MNDEKESHDKVDDHNENEDSHVTNRFTLEEMENVIEWVDQHPNAKLATIRHIQKDQICVLYTISRQYIENDGTGSKKLKQTREFMFIKFYMKS